MKDNEKGESVKKLEVKWTVEEDKLANYNSKALNSIFNVVDANQFKLISTCKIAKDAWEILEIARKGTNAMRLSKLQILTTHFENLKIKEEESIGEFNARLYNIVNKAFTLGERFSEEKLMRKTLRSLPRFAYKVTAIEEANDIQKMKLEESIGSLRTFEMNLEEERSDKKEKGIALQVEESESICNEDDDLDESIAILSKNFSKVMSRLNRSGPRSRFSRGGASGV